MVWLKQQEQSDSFKFSVLNAYGRYEYLSSPKYEVFKWTY